MVEALAEGLRTRRACGAVRELDSNEIDESDSQDEKHEEPRIWTVEGIKIDCSDENENAYDSIRVNCELDSNEIDESDLHHEKHPESRI
jgi:hypothetical protein